MISETDKSCIVELAQKYGVTRILLFGSSIDKTRSAEDIDLGVEGLPPSLFFKFYGELILGLSKPVDLVDISTETHFARMVAAEGVAVYG